MAASANAMVRMKVCNLSYINALCLGLRIPWRGHAMCLVARAMRPDMPQLLVERGHAHRAWSTSKGWRSRGRLRHAIAEDGDGWLPPRHRPSFSENLAPLRRYLRAQVDRPWNLVYAEIRSRIDTGNAVQYHILQHLYDHLAVTVTIAEDGSLWHADRWGRPSRLDARWGPELYVCPRTGLLRRSRRHRRHQAAEPAAPRDHLPGPEPDHDYRLLAGQWYEVWWGADPATGARQIVRKRQLGRRELRDLGLRP